MRRYGQLSVKLNVCSTVQEPLIKGKDNTGYKCLSIVSGVTVIKSHYLEMKVKNKKKEKVIIHSKKCKFIGLY